MATGQEVTPDRPSSVSDFKKATGHLIKLPSGQTCRARRPGMDLFVKQGMIPNSLMPMVTKALSEHKPPSQRDVGRSLDVTTELLSEMGKMYDAIAAYVITEPTVLPTPEQESDRDPEQLYADELEFEDKMFLFNWAVGGSSDVERFRKEQASALESLQPSEDVELPAESVAGDPG